MITLSAVRITKSKINLYRDMRQCLDTKVVNEIEKKTYFRNRTGSMSIWENILQ